MTSKSQFVKLFEPIQIRGMKAKNRLVMTAMLGGSDESGFVSQQMINMFEECSKGGVGTIVLGAVCVEAPRGRLLFIEPLIDEDKYIPGLSKVAQAMQKYGAKAVMQLFHGGHASPARQTGVQPISASAIARPGGDIPREMTVEEIAEMVVRFAKAAERAKKAGFDAVQIHAANRYLINSFLSPAWNKRQDQYGGDIENRTRFLVEIIKAIRAAVGEDFPIFCRINAMEYGMENGIDLEQAKQIAIIIEEAGIDVIDVSTVNPYTSASPSYYVPEGDNLELAEGIKKVVKIPVGIAGRNTPELGEKAIRDNQADMIAMARPMIADPDFPNKVAAGNLDDIIPCQSCNSCRGATRGYPGAVCAINPVAQRQWEFRLTPAEKSRNVLVIGGGPGGMEAAKDAALKGHKVTLIEKRDQLGGMLRWAAIPPCKEKITDLINYLARQVEKTGVQVKLGQEVTVEMVEQMKPDVIIIATGTNPIIPKVPGVDGKNVITALDALWGSKEVGEKVVVIGGGLIGCETADFLAEKGKKVTIVEMLDQIGSDVGPIRGVVMDRIARVGIQTLVKTKMEEVTPDGVKVTKDGTPDFIKADTVIMAVGLKANAELAAKLEGKASKIILVGDCLKPRRILEAIHDGFNAAWKL